VKARLLLLLAALQRAAFFVDPILPYLVADWRYTVLFTLWCFGGLALEEN
jgi:hypothetical protein